MASNKCEGNTETIPKSGSPLVKAFDKKAKGYLKALQRSLSSSSLERYSNILNFFYDLQLALNGL